MPSFRLCVAVFLQILWSCFRILYTERTILKWYESNSIRPATYYTYPNTHDLILIWWNVLEMKTVYQKKKLDLSFPCKHLV